MQSMHLLNNFHLCVVSNVGLLDFALPSYGNSHHPINYYDVKIIMVQSEKKAALTNKKTE